MLRDEDRDTRQVLREMYRCELRHLAAAKVQHVTVQLCDDPLVRSRSGRLDGKVLKIADALDLMPLPVPHSEAARDYPNGGVVCDCN